MLMLAGLFITLVGFYAVAHLIYLGEQPASKLSKSVTMLSVCGIFLIIVVNWFIVYSVSEKVNRLLNQ